MAVLDEIIRFITSGNIGGLPTIVIMVLPFIIGLIVGWLAHKFLKMAIIGGIILVVVAYFGFFGLSLGALKNVADTYGPIAIQYGTILVGMLPLGLGFFVGAIIGFVFSR